MKAGGAGGTGDLGEPANLTLPEYIYSTYNSLLKAGWRMHEIDDMDMLGFLKVRAWDVQREYTSLEPKLAFIDQVWPSNQGTGP